VDLPIFGTGRRDLAEAARGSPVERPYHCLEAQVRLCARYRRLIARGKKSPVVTTAIARELAAFLWAIGQQVAPQTGVTPAS
jgi:transposase